MSELERRAAPHRGRHARRRRDERMLAHAMMTLTLTLLVALALLYGFGAWALASLAIATTLIGALILGAHHEERQDR